MKQIVRRWLVVVIFAGVVLGVGRQAYAEAPCYEASNHGDFCRQMVEVLRQRTETVAFYYPGISRDMVRYRKKDYTVFFEDLSKEDAYVVSGIEAIQIQYTYGREDPVTFEIQYRTTYQQERYVERKVKRLTRKVKDQSEFERIRWGRDYLLQHMQYDNRYYTAYDAFRRGQGNCMAYSYAFLKLMQELEIPCVYVSSKHHAWNMVKLRGRWYHIDTTWEATWKKDAYFLRGQEDFRGHEKIRWGLPEKGKIAKRRYIYRCMCK